MSCNVVNRHLTLVLLFTLFATSKQQKCKHSRTFCPAQLIALSAVLTVIEAVLDCLHKIVQYFTVGTFAIFNAVKMTNVAILWKPFEKFMTAV